MAGAKLHPGNQQAAAGNRGDPFLLQALPARRPPLKMLEHHAYWEGESLKGNLFSSTGYMLKVNLS